jgi:hypothetical protein
VLHPPAGDLCVYVGRGVQLHDKGSLPWQWSCGQKTLSLGCLCDTITSFLTGALFCVHERKIEKRRDEVIKVQEKFGKTSVKERENDGRR